MCEVCGGLMMWEDGDRHRLLEDCVKSLREDSLTHEVELDSLREDLEALERANNRREYAEG